MLARLFDGRRNRDRPDAEFAGNLAEMTVRRHLRLGVPRLSTYLCTEIWRNFGRAHDR